MKIFRKQTAILLAVLSLTSCGWFSQKTKSKGSRTAALSFSGTDRIANDNGLLAIGRGYDSLTGQAKDFCIIDPRTEPEDANDQDSPSESTENMFSRASSAEQISTALHTGVSATFGFGAASGSASYAYMQSTDLSRYADHLFVHASAVEKRRLIHQPFELKKKAKDALRLSAQSFLSLCGDEYVAGEIVGGDFLAVFDAEAATETEQQNVRMAFSASYLRNDITATQLTDFKKTISKYQINVHTLRNGPKEASPDNSVDAIIKYAQEFSGKKFSPWTIAYLTINYPQLSSISNLSPNQARTMSEAAFYMRQLYARRSGLKYVEQNKGQFPLFDSGRLANELTALDKEINRVHEFAQECSSDGALCEGLSDTSVQPLPPRVENWYQYTVEDTKSDQAKTIPGVSGADKKILEGKGKWYASCAIDRGVYNGSLQFPNELRILFVDRNGSGPTINGAAGLLIPPNYDVQITIKDNFYKDNCVNDKDDPLSVRVVAPIYPDDYRYPAAYDSRKLDHSK